MSGTWELFLADPQANEALAGNHLLRARDKFMAMVEDDPGVGLEYAYRAARPALWARDLADAKALKARYDELGGYGSVAEARGATINAGIAALEGRARDALVLYRDALRGWRATNSTWDEALTGTDMAELLDAAEPEVAAAVKSTREILVRLGARPYIERLDAAVARGASAPKASPVRESVVPEVALSD